jgi:hypothetical protein
MSLEIVKLSFLQEYLRGKKVAVIANTTELVGSDYGKYVDSYDCVVRFNKLNISEKETGVKTTIHVMSNSDAINFNSVCDYRIIVAENKKDWDAKFKLVVKGKQKGVLQYTDFRVGGFCDQYPKDLYPSTEFFMIKLLDTYVETESLAIIGVEKPALSLYRNHDYDYEMDWIETNYALEGDIKVSVVVIYDGGRDNLLSSLTSISHSSLATVTEVIIVDNHTKPEDGIEDIKYQFNFILDIIYGDQLYARSLNFGINKSRGRVLVLQNSNIVHFGDILYDAYRTITNKNYLIYSVYQLNIDTTYKVYSCINSPDFMNEIKGFVYPIKDKRVDPRTVLGWIQHTHYTMDGTNEIRVITKDNVTELGGFDERKTDIVNFADNEFLHKVKTHKNLRVVLVDNPFALKQFRK